MNPNDPQWDLLVKLTLGENIHSERKKSFILSRRALQLCLEEQGVHLRPHELILLKYSTLKDFPEFTLSLAHTKGSGAALLADSSTYRSVGIDIESIHRPVKESVIKRVGHSDDDGSLRNIELWCLKEAAFKAIMNTGDFEKPVEFSSIRISTGLWSHSPSGVEGEWDLEIQNGIVIARAFLKN
ncbi:MAG: 4'-phosphopantetheinyl transferase family protein [Bacteriovoracia bacterium]